MIHDTKKIKVRANNMEDLIFMNETMVNHKDLNFDVSSGSINLDGKSLVGLLGLGVCSFDIRISGNNHDEMKVFIAEMNNYIV